MCLTTPDHVAAVTEAVRAACTPCPGSEAPSDLRVAIVGAGCRKDVCWLTAAEWLAEARQAATGKAANARDAVATVARLILLVPMGSRLELSWSEGGDPAADDSLGLAAYLAVRLAADRGISVECTLTEWAPAGCEAICTQPAEGQSPLSALMEVLCARRLKLGPPEQATHMFAEYLRRKRNAASLDPSPNSRLKRKTSAEVRVEPAASEAVPDAEEVSRRAKRSSADVRAASRPSSSLAASSSQHGQPGGSAASSAADSQAAAAGVTPAERAPLAPRVVQKPGRSSSSAAEATRKSKVTNGAGGSAGPLARHDSAGSSAGGASADSSQVASLMMASSSRGRAQQQLKRPDATGASSAYPSQSRGRTVSLRRGHSLVNRAGAGGSGSDAALAGGAGEAATAAQQPKKRESVRLDSVRETIKASVAALAAKSSQDATHQPWVSTLAHHLANGRAERIAPIGPPTPAYLNEAQARLVEEAVLRSSLKKNSEHGSWLAIAMPPLPFARLGGVPSADISTAAPKPAPSAPVAAPTAAAPAASASAITAPARIARAATARATVARATTAPTAVAVTPAEEAHHADALEPAASPASQPQLEAPPEPLSPPEQESSQPEPELISQPEPMCQLEPAPEPEPTSQSEPEASSQPQPLSQPEPLSQTELPSQPGPASQPDAVLPNVDWAESNRVWASQLATDRLRLALGSDVPVLAGQVQRLLLDRLRQEHELDAENLQEAAADDARLYLDEIFFNVVVMGLAALKASLVVARPR